MEAKIVEQTGVSLMEGCCRLSWVQSDKDEAAAVRVYNRLSAADKTQDAGNNDTHNNVISGLLPVLDGKWFTNSTRGG